MKPGKISCLLSVCLLFVCLCSGIAQEKFKFGEVSTADLSEAVYANDTTAAAVVLYEDCEVRYDVENNDFALRTYHTVRIKVLKPAGLGWADISLPFYVGSSRDKSEKVYGISGNTYNLVSGKPERTKLSKEYIFEEKTSENWQRIKIAFPNVKAGSIFELKYEKSSPYYHSLEDFSFQRSIPVKYCRYKVTIPEYFKFGKRTTGYERLDYSEKTANVSLLLGGGNTLRCNGQEMTFVGQDIPAMKDDSYVWNKNDYTVRVLFDLKSVEVPGQIYKNFTVTWQDIDKLLTESEEFGRQLRFSGLMKEEMALTVNDGMSPATKAEAILNLVKEKIQWNDDNALYIGSVKKAVKEGKGTSAEMNAALICLLRDAGFDAYPVVMSLRSRGRIFSMYPSLKSLNYFITGVNIDGKPAYMDASHKYGTINVIPADCMVQEALCILKDKPAQWVDLHETGRNRYMTTVMAGFNDDGKLSGNVQKIMGGVPCMSYARMVDKQKSKDEYKAKMETDANISISELEQGTPQNASVTETFSFASNDVMSGDEYIYVNSLIFPYFKDNPFKAETRKLPVEYPYPYDHMMSVTLMIPKGYTAEEVPGAEKITLGDNQIVYSYHTKKDTSMIQIVQRVSVRQTLYSAQEYEHVRDFWTHIVNKNNAQIVLKRVSE